MKTSVQKQNYCVDCFKSLSVDARHTIYLHLRKNGPATVTELTEFVGLKQPTVSYHLKDMEESGLLRSRRAGKQVHYSVAYDCPHKDSSCVLKEVDFWKE